MTTRTTTNLLDWLLTPLSWAVEYESDSKAAYALFVAFWVVSLPWLILRTLWKATIMADLTLIEWEER